MVLIIVQKKETCQAIVSFLRGFSDVFIAVHWLACKQRHIFYRSLSPSPAPLSDAPLTALHTAFHPEEI